MHEISFFQLLVSNFTPTNKQILQIIQNTTRNVNRGYQHDFVPLFPRLAMDIMDSSLSRYIDLTELTSLGKQLTEEKIPTELKKITEQKKSQDEKVASEMKEEWHYKCLTDFSLSLFF